MFLSSTKTMVAPRNYLIEYKQQSNRYLESNLCLTETRVTADKNQIKLSVFVTRFVTVHQNSTGKTLGKPVVLDS